MHNLACHKAVGEAHNKAVLRRVVLVLGLRDKALARVIVSLTLTATAVLDLVAREVSVRLNSLGERLC